MSFSDNLIIKKHTRLLKREVYSKEFVVVLISSRFTTDESEPPL